MNDDFKDLLVSEEQVLTDPVIAEEEVVSTDTEEVS